MYVTYLFGVNLAITLRVDDLEALVEVERRVCFIELDSYSLSLKLLLEVHPPACD